MLICFSVQAIGEIWTKSLGEIGMAGGAMSFQSYSVTIGIFFYALAAKCIKYNMLVYKLKLLPCSNLESTKLLYTFSKTMQNK